MIDITKENWDSEVIKSDVPVLVDFWATWCEPCKAMHKSLEEMEKEFGGKVKIVKVNVADNDELIQEYGVRSVPFFVIMKGGKKREQLLGMMNKAILTRKINEIL